MCTLILLNANVITMDRALPRAEAVAIEDERIVLVGSNRMARTLKRGRTRCIDCKGLTLLPGFIDAHCHVIGYAERLACVNLSPNDDIRSISDILQRIREACGKAPPGAWVKGKGYSEFDLTEMRHPNRADLDAAAPRHPVQLTHRSGHAHVLNSLALGQVGINAETGDPPGALIDREPTTGEPTGVLFGMGGCLSERIPHHDGHAMRQALSLANEKLVSSGITSLQDVSPGNNSIRWRELERIKQDGLLQPRLNAALGWSGFLEWREDPALFRSDHGLKCGGVKLIVGQVTGNLEEDQEELNARVLAIHKAGLQAIIHAVEPEAIAAACLAIEQASSLHPRKNHRHRIEHCSVCPPELTRRLVAAGISVVTQPSFIYYSGDRYLATVPADDLDFLYAAGAMANSGIAVGFSSDFPVSDPNPLVGIYAAVTRRTQRGRELDCDTKMQVAEAIHAYTIGSASAAFEEEMKGSISTGKFADLILLSDDPLECDPERMKDIEVLMTIVGGKVARSKDAADWLLSYSITPALRRRS